MSKYEKIYQKIGLPALLEQLGEECGELSQASLKMSRKIRGENPTPKTREELVKAFEEEIADVMLCINIIEWQHDVDVKRIFKIMDDKTNRWLMRLEEGNGECRD